MLTFQTLRNINQLRTTNPRTYGGFGHNFFQWSIAEWTNAMAGEAGEACNIAKKIIRYRDDMEFLNKGATLQDLTSALCDEIADTVIYADLVLASQNQSLQSAIINKFNRDSDKINSSFKLV